MANTVYARLVGDRQLDHGDTTIYHLTVVDEDNVAQPFPSMLTMEGYEIPESGDALSDTDTVLEALGKLEARLAVLEDV